jgi:hypothetical protein
VGIPRFVASLYAVAPTYQTQELVVHAFDWKWDWHGQGTTVSAGVGRMLAQSQGTSRLVRMES